MTTTQRIIPPGVRSPDQVGRPDPGSGKVDAQQVKVLPALLAKFVKRPAVSTDSDAPTLLVPPDPNRSECLVLVDPVNGGSGDFVWVGSDATDTSDYMPIAAAQGHIHKAASALYGYAQITSGATHLDVYTDDEVH